ncbi:MAG: phosphoenolpyruvate carboxylase [Schleiferiaceae bacterium]|nr:phosphoenolpyruvate carboxylase [Schleiferiaceae bacterium]
MPFIHMNEAEKLELFREIVKNKYIIYNSLFLNLPNEGTTNTGIYIPLLAKLSREGYAATKQPKEIIADFFSQHTTVHNRSEQFDLLFRMVQYIERQVVLFDSVEDAAFARFNRKSLKDWVVPNAPNYGDWQTHFRKFSARLVFTAHPTQFYSEDVQTIMRGLRTAIKEDGITTIDNLLQQLAFTPFVKREKPSPYDEAQNILFYLRFVYYDTFGKLYHKIGKLIDAQPDFNPHLLEMGFWPGGDRDGNPFVSAETTLKVATLLRKTIFKCYYNHVKVLRRKLTFSKTAPLMQTLKDRLYNELFGTGSTITHQEILDILNEVSNLVESDYKGLNVEELNDLIGRVHLFGSHFATLDIRQDSSKHLEAIAQIFEQEFQVDYQQLSHQEKIEYLTNRSLQIDPAKYSDETTRDTLINVYQIRDIQKMNGERGLHRYIISNTETIFDVLHVYAFFKYCGYRDADIHIDIVPLFETMIGMAQSDHVMRELYELPLYQAHLQNRKRQQTVMLGFSDGTKDGGYLKANWEIYRTKERLTALAREYDYQVVFFDGRGGPPARGGGKTHQFYAAQGQQIASDKIQLTIQGQTISSIYGTEEQATYNVEQLLIAGAQHLRPKQYASEEHKELISDLADRSFQKYTELKQHPLFVPYLENMTTLKYYGATNIGSRPTKRNATEKLELKSLRAIPFVGAWSLVRQNVPGYFGLGSALEAYADRFEAIEELYRDSPFFRVLMLNSTMSMKKSFFPLTAYMQHDPKYGAFWKALREEYLLTKKWVLHLTGETELMEREPLSRMSISMREQLILPLLTIQQYALQQIQANDPDKEIFEKLVVRTLFGNINASRNSA